jgi:hypothetical protein
LLENKELCSLTSQRTGSKSYSYVPFMLLFLVKDLLHVIQMPELTDSDLAEFLVSLASKIEDGNASNSELRMTGEFQMAYSMAGSTEAVERDDILSFLTLGWWVYSHMDKDVDKDLDKDVDKDVDTVN